jgi:AAA+ superfamily predicted ATPase
MSIPATISQLKECEDFAREQNLAFCSFYNSYDKKRSDATNIIKEFNLSQTIHDTPVYTELIKKEITINDKNYTFYVRTIIFSNMDESPEMYPIIFGDSLEEIDMLFKYLDQKHNPNKCNMYVWDVRAATYVNSKYKVPQVKESDLVGLDNFFDSIKNEIESIISKTELARKLGADSGTNLFTYGPPGTGKTSSFKAVGYAMNVPVYTVNLSLIPTSHFKFALSPVGLEDNDIKIVIIEDFDRYIVNEEDENESLSELLNALDGVHSSFGVIRIFSANMPELALKDKAMKTRFSKFIKFELPTSEIIKEHLMNLFPEDEKNVDIFVNLTKDMNLSFREINHYIRRFIIKDNLLEAAIAYFPEWMKEKEEVEQLEKIEQFNDETSIDNDSDKYIEIIKTPSFRYAYFLFVVVMTILFAVLLFI